MSLSKEKIELSKRLALTCVINSISEKQNITSEEALHRFSKTKTFALLQKDKAELYLESDEYILDMLRSEVKGDWDNWFDI